VKQFKFRLAPLLRLRRQEEDEKKRVVSDLLSRMHAQQQEAVVLGEALQAEAQVLRDQQESGRVDMDWLSQYYRYVLATREAIRERIGEVVSLQQRLVGARGELAQAARGRKTLEKLEEKQRERYDRRLSRLERNEQDEIASQLYFRPVESGVVLRAGCGEA